MMQMHAAKRNMVFVVCRSCGVVVITSALHAEGRGFETRHDLPNFYLILLEMVAVDVIEFISFIQTSR